jgi:hypothetical protein
MYDHVLCAFDTYKPIALRNSYIRASWIHFLRIFQQGTAEGLMYYINMYILQFKYYNSCIKREKQKKMEKITQRGSF